MVRRPLISWFALIVCVIPASVGAGVGQDAESQTSPLTFEVASIKPTKATGQEASVDRRQGNLTMRNATLRD